MASAKAALAASDADVRWETDHKLHCTLRFLGEVDQSRVTSVIDVVDSASAQAKPLVIRYRDVGCFPNRHDPRVIWIGMEDAGGHLMNLQRMIEDGLAAIGFEHEDRPFHPHVTLGRIKSQHNIGHLLRTMETVTFTAEPVTVREIDVVRSELKPAGSVYTSLKLIPLRG